MIFILKLSLSYLNSDYFILLVLVEYFRTSEFLILVAGFGTTFNLVFSRQVKKTIYALVELISISMAYNVSKATMSDEGEKSCPLCAEEMDLTDQQLKPCKCGYEVCCDPIMHSVCAYISLM